MDTNASVAYSPDGKILATTGIGNAIGLWDPHTGEELGALCGHTADVRSIAFSPNGKLIASGSRDKTVRIWDVATRKELHCLNDHEQEVNSVAFSTHGDELASGSTDATIKLWRTATGGLVRTLHGHTGAVNSVVFQRGGKLLASASDDKSIKLWDLATGREQRTITDDTEPVCCVSFSPDGKQLLSASMDKTIKVFRVHDGQEVNAMRVATYVAVFTADGKHIVSAGYNGLIQVWNTATGAEMHPRSSPASQVVSSEVVYHAKKQSGPADLPTFGDRGIWFVYAKCATSLAISPEGSSIAIADRDGSVNIWDTASGRQRCSVAGQPYCKFLVFSPNSKWLVSDSGSSIRLREAATGRQICCWQAIDSGGGVPSIAFSPDGSKIYSIVDLRTPEENSMRHALRVWDFASRTCLQTLELNTKSENQIAVSPDGQTLATGTDADGLALFEAKTLKKLAALHGFTRSAATVAFSPNGQLIAAGIWDSTVRVWNVKSRELVHVFKTNSNTVSIAFSPDGKTLATGADEDGCSPMTAGHHGSTKAPNLNTKNNGDPKSVLVQIWNVADGKLLGSFSRRTQYPTTESIAFSADGKTLACINGPGLVAFWNIETGKILPIGCASDGASRIVFSPNGSMFAVNSPPLIDRWTISPAKRLPTYMESACGKRKH